MCVSYVIAAIRTHHLQSQQCSHLKKNLHIFKGDARSTAKTASSKSEADLDVQLSQKLVLPATH